MELKKEDDAKFTLHHQITEEKLLHLEKGVRILGFQSGGKRIMTAFFALAVICLLLKGFFEGTLGNILAAVGGAMFLAFLAGTYALVKGWMDAKHEIRLKFEANKKDFDFEWEYRFYEDCYEIIGKHERSRVDYGNIGRLIDMSGMLVMVEKGNVVRYFMKNDLEKGDAGELAGFLERKSGMQVEHVSVG